MTTDLCEYATEEFRLSGCPEGSDVPLRDHLRYVAKQIGNDSLYEEPQMPVGGEIYWNWFMQLHAARGSSGFGPSPLSYEDINAWATRMRIYPTPLEVELLKMLDITYLQVILNKKGGGKP